MIRHTTGTGAHTRVRWYLSFLGNLALWAVIAFNGWFLWPSSLGGATTFIIVNGNSMEPSYEPGDLLIAREGKPSVGDIIVYRPDGYGEAKVVHQIVGGDGESGWVMKGQNNDWLDPWKPTNDEVVGIVHVHFPSVGAIAVILLSPILWASILVIAIGLLLWPDHKEEEEPNAAAALAESPGFRPLVRGGVGR